MLCLMLIRIVTVLAYTSMVANASNGLPLENSKNFKENDVVVLELEIVRSSGYFVPKSSGLHEFIYNTTSEISIQLGASSCSMEEQNVSEAQNQVENEIGEGSFTVYLEKNMAYPMIINLSQDPKLEYSLEVYVKAPDGSIKFAKEYIAQGTTKLKNGEVMVGHEEKYKDVIVPNNCGPLEVSYEGLIFNILTEKTLMQGKESGDVTEVSEELGPVQNTEIWAANDASSKKFVDCVNNIVLNEELTENHLGQFENCFKLYGNKEDGIEIHDAFDAIDFGLKEELEADGEVHILEKRESEKPEKIYTMLGVPLFKTRGPK